VGRSINIERKNPPGRPRGAAPGVENPPDGFGLKPQLDEHHGNNDRAGGGGLRGEDKRQAALKDSAPRTSNNTPPEGLSRARTHPLNPSEGRGGNVPPHVPSSNPE
jgi:hypothetical protein